MKYTTRELIESVREQVAEANNTRVSTSQIRKAINRGYDSANDMLAKQYADPLLAYIEAYPDSEGQITIPEDAFQDRVESVEFYPNGADNYRSRIQETDDVSAHGAFNNVKGGYPSLYSIIGRKIQLAPKNMQRTLIRVWYVKTPLPLVVDQGRIQIVDTVSNYIVVDSLNTSEAATPISATSAYGKYVNIADATTGEIKCTLQVESIDDNQLVFKANPTRTTVYNLPVVGAIPDTVTPDDVISAVDGLGVLFFNRPLANYLVQYAVNEVQRSLGVSNLSFEESKLREMRKLVEESWRRRPGAKFKRQHGKVWKNNPWTNW
jgi:hypothetical protein